MLKENKQDCSELVGLDHSNKKRLAAYQKVTEQVERQEAKL